MKIAKSSRWLAVLLISVFILTAAPVSVAATSESHSRANRQLLDAEAQLAAALISSDVERLSRIWAEDFVSTLADGHVVSRASRLASLRAQPPDAANKITSSNDRIEIQAYGHWAIVLVTSSWRVDGTTVGDPYQATHVWGKRNGVWRLVAAHISPVKT